MTLRLEGKASTACRPRNQQQNTLSSTAYLLLPLKFCATPSVPASAHLPLFSSSWMLQKSCVPSTPSLASPGAEYHYLLRESTETTAPGTQEPRKSPQKANYRSNTSVIWRSCFCAGAYLSSKTALACAPSFVFSALPSTLQYIHTSLVPIPRCPHLMNAILPPKSFSCK